MQIPGYKIIKPIGQGGMSTVYLAIQKNLDRLVALKVMQSPNDHDTNKSRFLKEGKTVAQLSHPHITAIFEVGAHQHNYYIAMEYLSGGNLSRRIANYSTLPPSEAARILSEVAMALGYAHRSGYVHRDVKSENILFRDNGQAVMADFGIVKVLASKTNMTGSGKSIGTPLYMSPEQARGQTVDSRSDIYSLGIVLYEMLCGKVPFKGKDFVAIGMMHVNAPIPQLPASVAIFRPILKKMLAKSKEGRYQTAEQLIDAINKISQNIQRQNDQEKNLPQRTRLRKTLIVTAILAVFGGLLLGFQDQVWQQKTSLLWQRFGVTLAPYVPGFEGYQQPITGILQIDSNIPARLFLNGRPIGPSPYEGPQNTGSYRLRAEADYHIPIERNFTLDTKQPQQLQLNFMLGTGNLDLDSTPPGAEVFLNKEPRSRFTPVLLADLPAGEYELRLRLKGYQDKVLMLQLQHRQTLQVRGSLLPEDGS